MSFEECSVSLECHIILKSGVLLLPLFSLAVTFNTRICEERLVKDGTDRSRNE